MEYFIYNGLKMEYNALMKHLMEDEGYTKLEAIMLVAELEQV